MRERWLTERVAEMLERFPVVLVQGARQAGKTTLVRQLISMGVLQHYYSFDDLAALALAQADPPGFVANLPTRCVIDEVQRVPEVLLAIKARVDQNRASGQFVLTGSAHPLARLRIGEPLVGRMGALTLHPFSQGEVLGVRERWLERSLQGQFLPHAGTSEGLWERIAVGGYPPAVLAPSPEDAHHWLHAYIETILTREVRELAEIERVSDLPLLARLIASFSAQLFNLANLSRESGIPQTTLRRYLNLFEAMFLIVRIPAWYTNVSQRLMKTPKILINDTGLACALLNIDAKALEQNPLLKGRMLESFVGLEILKQIEFSGYKARLYHFRTNSGHEVDFVLETASGKIVGVEVKASASIDGEAFRGLKHLREIVDERWMGGVVLYTGDQSLPFGQNLWAQPIGALWANYSALN